MPPHLLRPFREPWLRAIGNRQRGREFHFQSEGAVAALFDVGSQFRLVVRENHDPFPPPRDGDIPLVAVRCHAAARIRKKHSVNRLALRGIRRDGIAAIKQPLSWGERLARPSGVLDYERAILTHAAHRHQFTVGNRMTLLRFTVEFQLQAVTRGYFQFPFRRYRQPIGVTIAQRRAPPILDKHDAMLIRPGNWTEIALGETPIPLQKIGPLPGLVETGLAFLRLSAIHRLIGGGWH